MKIEFDELLKTVGCERELQGTSMVCRHKCGCVVNLTFAGRPQGISLEKKLKDAFWIDSSECLCEHDVDFSKAIKASKVVGLTLVAMSIHVNGNMDKVLELYSETLESQRVMSENMARENAFKKKIEEVRLL